MGVNSWFLDLKDAIPDFVSEERVVWVDIEGITLNIWSRETFVRIGKKWGEIMDLEDNSDSSFGPNELFTWNPCFLEPKEMVYSSNEESVRVTKKNLVHSHRSEEDSIEDSDMERVSESVFGINSSSHKDSNGVIGDQVSEYPFGFYGLLKNQQAKEVREPSPSMSHPHGFTPEVSEIRKDIENTVSKEFSPSVNAKVMSNSQEIHEESNGDVASPYVVHNGGSVLGLLEDMIRVGKVMGYSLEGFKKKLEDLKLVIRRWVKDKKSKKFGARNSIKKELADIDKVLDLGDVSDVMLLRRDENSSFFHGIINKKRSHLSIRGVFVDGLWVTNPDNVKDAFLKHFEDRFRKPVAHRLKLLGSFNKQLSPGQAAELDRCVSSEEIRMVVWSCGENKSPGPDGFTFEFFQKYWSLIGPDLCAAVDHFFVNGSFPMGCNASFIALIPKVMDAKFVIDFRPISLVGSIYKVVTKLDNIKSIQLNDDDLILVEDSSTVVLIKVKEIKIISNMYHVCQAEGFVDVKIHYVGGLWVWLQFSSVNSCEAFKSNESLNKLWTFIKVPSPFFVVDERVIWIEVSGLPLCAWGSSAFKKITNLFGKFNFFDDDVEDSMCMGRAYITTKIKSLISEKVNVTIKDSNFNVHVKEISTWSALIYNDMDSNESDDDHDMEEHRSTNEDVDLNAALDDFIQQNIVKENALKDFKEGDQANVSTHVAGDNETLFSEKVKEEYFVTKEDKPSEEDMSDTSKPPGFENFIKEIVNAQCLPMLQDQRKNYVEDFYIINVYGPQHQPNKSTLWSILRDFILSHPGKVILFGDLNEVRNDFERVGSIFSSGDAAIFNDFIQESGLIDLPMGDNVNHDIPNLQVVALDRRWSDHNPILFHSKKFDFGLTSFRIFNSWFDRIDFEKVVKDKWDDITGEVLGHTKSLHTKLKDLKSHLKIWYSHTKEVETSRMNLLLADMQNLDQKNNEGLASDEDKSSRISKLQELDYFEKMNSLDSMQKARVKWKVEGDENSKFFHGLINSRRKSQSIHGIMHEGVWLSDPKDIKEAFLNFYNKKFSCHDSQASFPSFMHAHNLNTSDQDLLESVVSMEEIKIAVWDCGSNKAPGLDGYSFLFIKRFWDLLKHDIQEFVVIKAFHGNEAGIDLGGCQTSGTWAKIVGTINHLHSSGIVPLNSICFKVEDGSSIRFWKDTWLGNDPLYIRYNILFHLENNKDCFISQRILNGSWEWNCCRPITTERYKTEFDNLIIDISNMEIDDLVESDTCVWSLSNDDSFSVNLVRKHIDEHSLPSLFPCTRWYKMIPKKVNVFMWRMLLDRLPNRLNLSSRGLDIDSISCMVCNGHVESNDHIFFTCDAAVAIWNLVRSWIDLPLPSFLSCEDWTN
nr:RNA-directed DNA polymerase, eukaryota, reverse transcriptase zinc-binding domain protein [Tanacetum cinerariifolium]